MFELTLLLINILFAALIAHWADSWGRNKWGWFFGGLLSPLIAAIILLIVGKVKDS
jgi:hypothetical protein